MTMRDDRTTVHAVSDAAIASMFDRRARRSDGADLRSSILAATASAPQVRRWRLEMSALVSTRMQRLLVVGLIVIALAALALIGSGAFRQDRIPKATTEWFLRPFEYAIPAASALRPAADGPHYDAIAWVEGGNFPRGINEDPPYGGQLPGSGGVRGIIVATGEHAWSHGTEGRFFLRPAPAEFIADLRDTAGVDMGPVAEATLDGRPALTTMITGPGGNDIHVDGPITGLTFGHLFVLLTPPTRLIVTEVDGETIFVLIWARTLDDLNAWMPVADEFIASIHFLPAGEPS
jgi:hypothetical protein